MTKKRLTRELKWGFQFFPYHQLWMENEEGMDDHISVDNLCPAGGTDIAGQADSVPDTAHTQTADRAGLRLLPAPCPDGCAGGGGAFTQGKAVF